MEGACNMLDRDGQERSLPQYKKHKVGAYACPLTKSEGSLPRPKIPSTELQLECMQLAAEYSV